MAKKAGVKNACWASSVEDFMEEFKSAVTRKAFSMIAAKTERGIEYLKSWRRLPSFQHGEVENGFRFMRVIEKTEGIRVVPLPGPRN
jgi:hypothetical protein